MLTPTWPPCEHLPGRTNTIAGFLSHQTLPPGEWRLHPQVVQLIWEQFGDAHVDLFASECSTHCPLWFSLPETSAPLGRGSSWWPPGGQYNFDSPCVATSWELPGRVYLLYQLGGQVWHLSPGRLQLWAASMLRVHVASLPVHHRFMDVKPVGEHHWMKQFLRGVASPKTDTHSGMGSALDLA